MVFQFFKYPKKKKLADSYGRAWEHLPCARQGAQVVQGAKRRCQSAAAGLSQAGR